MIRVKAGWYTIEVVSWMEAIESQDKTQLCIDVSKNKYNYWEVSTRKDETLNRCDPYAYLYDTAKEAKAHAIRLEALWADFYNGERDSYPTVREAA